MRYRNYRADGPLHGRITATAYAIHNVNFQLVVTHHSCTELGGQPRLELKRVCWWQIEQASKHTTDVSAFERDENRNRIVGKKIQIPDAI